MTVPETTPERRFVWPSAYYTSATPEAVLPRWVPYGCGAAAVLVIVIVFAGGAYLAGGGFVDLMDMTIGMSVAEAKGMYTGVPADRKQSLDREITAMRKNLREQKIAVQRLQPFLEALRKATSDNKITAAEAATLEEAARKANASAKRR